MVGGANKGRPNWSKLNGGRSTKCGGGRLSGGGGANGLPNAVRSKNKTYLQMTATVEYSKSSIKLIQTMCGLNLKCS